MFFTLSKTLGLLLPSPLAWSLLAFAVGVVLSARRRSRAASVVVASGMALLLTCSTPRFASWLFDLTERDAPRTYREGTTYDAVIVLGGTVDSEDSALHGTLEYNDAVERLLATFDLLRHDRVRFALVSGGDPAATAPEFVEATVLRRQLIEWGVDPARVVTDTNSRNTRENAIESARIVRERGWGKVVLVTSAFHMSRALECFRAVGVDVDTLPVDWRAAGLPSRGSLFPTAEALQASELALHELLGRVVYRAPGFGARSRRP